MSRRNFDKIVIVDVESTCWEGEPPSGQENEIIEVGVCLLDVETGERKNQNHWLIHPRVSTVSEYCTRLTGITQEDVEKGIPFEESCSMLRDQFESKERIWASYGDYDRGQFERQCKREGVKYPFGSRHINVKTLFAIVYGLQCEVGMAEALDILGIPLEGVPHRGGDDAWNIAAILSRIILTARSQIKLDAAVRSEKL